MYISVKKELLVQTLAHANRIIEKRAASPVLGCILFDANSDGIKITATNMDMNIIDIIEFHPVDCIVSEPGTYCLPVSLLYDISKKFISNSNVIISSKNKDEDNPTKEIHITNNKTNFSIHYIESSAFPPLNLVDNSYSDITFSMKSEDLKNAIDMSKVSMSQDIIRAQLNGIYIHYNEADDTLRFVSTDLFRISCASIKAPENSNNMKPIIISKKTVVELLHMLSDIDKDDIVNIKLSSIGEQVKQITLEININDNIKSFYSSRIVYGSFPEYKTALEINNNKVLVVNIKEFISAIDRVDTIVSDVSNIGSSRTIQLSISNDKLTISGANKELGKANEELECKYITSKNTMENNNIENNPILEVNNDDIYDADLDNILGLDSNDNKDSQIFEPEVPNSIDNEFNVCFNSKYLLELVKPILDLKMNTKEVYLYFDSNVSPTLIKPTLDGVDNKANNSNLSLVSVIMPVEIIHK
ncbi:MAG: DNA polymerase III subunit beta [Alphaproteobacteria bacterium]|nr:DNA polymerase III subunit beta [Alphaproteobacteria bacterium]